MKQVMLVLVALLLISNAGLSQTLQFHAYELTVEKIATGEIRNVEIDLNINFTDYDMTIIESELKFIFTSQLNSRSATQFFIYAIDANGTKCRIWFQGVTESTALLGIQYEDVILVYTATLIN